MRFSYFRYILGPTPEETRNLTTRAWSLVHSQAVLANVGVRTSEAPAVRRGGGTLALACATDRETFGGDRGVVKEDGGGRTSATNYYLGNNYRYDPR